MSNLLPRPTLPPLPDLERDAFWDPGGSSIVDDLDTEHRRMGALCTWLAQTRNPSRRRQIADVLTATVARHLSAEEQYLYPSVRAVLRDGDALADREIARGRVLLRTLRRLADAVASGPDSNRLVRAVAEQLDRHARGAGERLLPGLRAAVSETDLIRLGNRAQVAREAAPTRPHPNAPAAPPWNKLVEPALGIVDKTRDALSRRRTYPEDL